MRLLLTISLFITLPVWAGGGDDLEATATAGATASSVGSVHNQSDAIGLGLGDVDINDCYRSYQVAVVWQGTQANWWCIAREYDAMGLHAAAAQVRCKKFSAIRKLFSDLDSCLAANTVVVRPQEDKNLPTAQQRKEQDEEEFHVEQMALYEDLQEQIASLKEEVEKPPPQQVTRRVVEQQPRFTEEQKKALREAVQ